ncbi:MAG TPA: tripartite tricarboxylate transporter substrate-binding protein, partial [Ureibacillus sp.]|nr:tripartite tricarboxylate transporter substrate-binding protein [Ureibacillus sp.]
TGTPASLAAYKDTGEVNVLVNFGDAKIAGYEDVPTFKELGYDFGLSVSFGLVGPKGIESSVTSILHDAFKQAIEDPAIAKKIENLSVAATYGPAEELQADFTNVTALYEDILQTVSLEE